MDKPISIFAEVVCDKAYAQFMSAMSQDFAVKGALMPDVHAGYVLPIGAVVATKGVVVPAWVGYDIGCGMCAVQTNLTREDVIYGAKYLHEDILAEVPVGNRTHRANQRPMPIGLSVLGKTVWHGRDAGKQLGTLGGGNHFIEVGYDENNYVWITIHSGSRGFGHGLAGEYMKLASNSDKAKEGHFALDVNSLVGRNYINDMNIALQYALDNRMMMMDRVIDILEEGCGIAVERQTFTNRNHNHAEEKDGLWIHRKGATHAEVGMLGVIPGNMRDGCFIVEGKGNEDSLCTSSHGAGRVMSRSQAFREIDTDTFKEQMHGIVSQAGDGTRDEAPDAYKNIFDVMDQQKDLVEVLAYVKPILNVKG